MDVREVHVSLRPRTKQTAQEELQGHARRQRRGESCRLRMQEEKRAILSFKWALDAEKIHEDLYNIALKSAANGKDLDIEDVWICPLCGYAELKQPTEACPICGLAAEKFEKY